jgi:hypothetical protein
MCDRYVTVLLARAPFIPMISFTMFIEEPDAECFTFYPILLMGVVADSLCSFGVFMLLFLFVFVRVWQRGKMTQ